MTFTVASRLPTARACRSTLTINIRRMLRTDRRPQMAWQRGASIESKRFHADWKKLERLRWSHLERLGADLPGRQLTAVCTPVNGLPQQFELMRGAAGQSTKCNAICGRSQHSSNCNRVVTKS